MFAKADFVRKALSGLMAFVFAVVSVGTLYAQNIATMSTPGTMVSLSEAFAPPLLKGVKVYADNPFRLDFILDKGNPGDSTDQLKSESTRLIKYFLASITVPEKDLWVNLSPYEKDRIVPDAFGVTEMGRDLLAQDYMLKQITASVIYPEGEVGKAFWAKVYAEAQRRYGTFDVPVDTFNKVWIVPEKAVVYESKDSAYVVESRLKVMLETDYLAMSNGSTSNDPMNVKELQVDPVSPNLQGDLAKQILREVVIPILEKEVNEGKNFAQLRQVYHSLILAVWYKDKVKESIFGKAYVDQKKTGGIDIEDKAEKERIWAQYVEAFKKGAYNYIKEDLDPTTQQPVPRKYFSGGVRMDVRAVKQRAERSRLSEGVSDRAMVVRVNLDAAMTESERSERLAIAARSVFHGSRIFGTGLIEQLSGWGDDFTRMFKNVDEMAKSQVKSGIDTQLRIAWGFHLVVAPSDTGIKSDSVKQQELITKMEGAYQALKAVEVLAANYRVVNGRFLDPNRDKKYEEFLFLSLKEAIALLESRIELAHGQRSVRTFDIGSLLAKIQSLGYGATVRYDIDERVKSALIIGNVYSLQSAIRNLLVNAYEAVKRPDPDRGHDGLYAKLNDGDKLLADKIFDEAGPYYNVPAGLETVLSLQLKGGMLEISVRDHGPGITNIDKIFKLDETTKISGTGLGTTEAWYAVKDMGGTITAENRTEGGAWFTIRLPALDVKAALTSAGEDSAMGSGIVDLIGTEDISWASDLESSMITRGNQALIKRLIESGMIKGEKVQNVFIAGGHRLKAFDPQDFAQGNVVNAPGGIDLTRDKKGLQIQTPSTGSTSSPQRGSGQGEGQGIWFNFDPAGAARERAERGSGDVADPVNPSMIRQLQNASGLTPVIIDIQPMTTTVPMFLGLKDDAPALSQIRHKNSLCLTSWRYQGV